MSNIAMCVMTYNHPKVVDDVLSKCIENYSLCGIDIIYYDGSDNYDTKEVVNKYIDFGYNNLFYFHEWDDNSGTRFNRIMGGKDELEKYEYIWLAKDRSYCEMDMLKAIQLAAEEGHHVIFLGVNWFGNNVDTVYSDAKLFYRDWAWLATSMDVTIYNREKFLAGTDVKSYPSTFGSQYLILFTELSKIENPSVKVLCEYSQIMSSTVPVASSWENKIFEIWKDQWIDANMWLPNCYEEYKKDIIKKAASLPWLLGGKRRLCDLHEKGLLTEHNVDLLSEDWELVSDVPFETVREIAVGNYDYKHDLARLKSENESIEIIKTLSSFLKEGKLDINTVPFEDLTTIVKKNFETPYLINADVSDLYIGSIEDLVNIIIKYQFDTKDIANVMQLFALMINLSR